MRTSLSAIAVSSFPAAGEGRDPYEYLGFLQSPVMMYYEQICHLGCVDSYASFIKVATLGLNSFPEVFVLHW